MAIQVPEHRQFPRVSVIIPALNEARNLPHVLPKLPDDVHEVIVVDGHSTDNTIAVARQLRPDARIVMQTGRGKGNALACGFAAATGEILVTIDADGSNDPAEIPLFVKALVDGADFVKGSRYAKGGGSVDITRLRSFGNHVVRHMVNICCRTRYSDLCYGYTALWRRCVPALRLGAAPPGGRRRYRGAGFEVETLLSIRAAAAGLAVAEVPSFEHARIHGVSNLRPIRDGWRILLLLLLERRTWWLARRWRSRAAPALARTGQAPGAGQRYGEGASAAPLVSSPVPHADAGGPWRGALPAAATSAAGHYSGLDQQRPGGHVPAEEAADGA